MNWIRLEAQDLDTLKEHESILVSCQNHEYPYDIIQYGQPIEEEGLEEYWHSYMHINQGKYQYSTEELIDLFSHYAILTTPPK